MRTSDFDPVSVAIFNRQLRKVTLFVLAVFSILILRLWLLQIVHGPTYRDRSENNRIRLQDIPSFRGMIFDRKGNVLVDNRPAYNLYVIPEEVQDRDGLIRSLSLFAGLDPEAVEERLNDAPRGRPFMPVCLKKDISRDELAFIETHRFNLPGVVIKVEPQRHYIRGPMAFHLLGYLGEITENQIRSGQYPENKPGDLIGKSGVEARWQSVLNGTRGGEQVEVDAAGRKIRTISMKTPLPGANIGLTIDLDLQMTAEKALIGQKGAIAALDPDTGAVLALASSPSVDPNLFISGIDRDTWHDIATSQDYPLQDRAISGQYPPASVFKIIVALAGLEEGVIDPDETVICRGAFFLGTHRFNCWKKYGHGEVNLHKALTQSCDVYFYQQGKALGVEKIAFYAKKFGFGQPCGLDVGQEREGLVPNRDWKLKKLGVPWQPGETISMSIGQGFLLVTPLQMAGMIASVFNGGVLYRPQITRWVGKSETEARYEFSPQVTGKINIRQAHLEIVQNALIGAVNEPRGTGSSARIKGMTVAGKTGTAQVVSLKKGEDRRGKEDPPLHQHKDHGWFVAVAPAEHPQIALAIIIEHGEHGSSVAPIAKEMIQVYLGNEPPGGLQTAALVGTHP